MTYSLSRISKVRPKRVSSSSRHCKSMDGGAGDDGFPHLLAQQQLAFNQPGFDRLAQPDIIGDEQIDAGQEQGLTQRLKLVGIELDTCPERRLKQPGVRRRDAIPLQRVQIGRKKPWRIKPPLGHRLPRFPRDDLRVDLAFPQHLKRLPLVVIVHARQPNQGAVSGLGSGDCFLDEIQTLPDPRNLPRRGNPGGAAWRNASVGESHPLTDDASAGDMAGPLFQRAGPMGTEWKERRKHSCPSARFQPRS